MQSRQEKNFSPNPFESEHLKLFFYQMIQADIYQKQHEYYLHLQGLHLKLLFLKNNLPDSL